MDLLILDADGVFMDETPYWKTALATALTWHGIDPGSPVAWDALAAACIEGERLQRIPEMRGCNSNWDLAAVMVRALEPPATRESFASAAGRTDWSPAAGVLANGMRALLRSTRPARPSRPEAGEGELRDAGSPGLNAFDIDRDGEFFHRVVSAFQDIQSQRRTIDWRYARQALAAPAEELRATLRALAALGFSLAVCTSRGRDETVGPMYALGIGDCFDFQRIVTHDETLEAQRRGTAGPLQKPHWFPLACAALGFDAALAAVTDGGLHRRRPSAVRRVYVGDAPADFSMTSACHRAGLPFEYVHVDSGLTEPATLDAIRRERFTLGVAPALADVIGLLGDTVP